MVPPMSAIPSFTATSAAGSCGCTSCSARHSEGGTNPGRGSTGLPLRWRGTHHSRCLTTSGSNGPRVIEDVLPPKVASVDTFEDQPGDDIFPAEAAVISRAVDKRRREFTTVRTCARRALVTLGLEPQPILPDGDGAPSWPPGVVGSMTHCDGYRAAAVAWSREIACIGIDAEPHGPLPGGVLGVVANSREQEELAELADRDPSVCWDRLLFSAKESLYKAWFPLARTWLGFEDVHVIIDPDAGTFVGRLLITGPIVDGNPLDEIPGRWTARNGLVLTSVAVGRTSRTACQP